MRNSLLLFLVFGLVFGLSSAWASTGLPFSSGAHCVAYKVRKTTMLIAPGEVVGKNCDVSVQVLPELGGQYRIEVNIPVRSFESGDTSRDADVVKLLKVDVRPELTFKSKPYSIEGWRDLFNKGQFKLDGELWIGDKSYPLSLDTNYVDKGDMSEVGGLGRVKFQDFELTPPRVGLGIIAKTKPDFELHFHFLSNRILGANDLREATKDKR